MEAAADHPRRNICFLTGTLGQGGAERQLYYMLRALKDAGHRLTVLCFTRGEYWESRIAALGVPVIWVGQRTGAVARVLAIVSEIRRLRPDILQSSHFYTNLPAAIVGRLFRIPAIGAMRNDCISEVAANGSVRGRLNLRAPRLIAANSRLGIRNARAIGIPDRRLFFLPNVVDTNEFLAGGRRSHQAIRVVTAGRMVEQKRHDRFLRLLARLRDTVSRPVEGLIVGDGPLRSSLQRQARELGLNEPSLIFGGLSQRMHDVYKAADVFVLTSDWEGTPNVVLEAMASGVPVVSTDIGGVADLIEDGISGFLVKPDAAEDLAARVAQLVEDASLRDTLAKNARQRVEVNFSHLRLPGHFESLYATALTRP
jgi:glycosyltransferase involved in cell wall biosynthesis